ncbi:hypothetical protein B0T10DRAFT_602757 [Thelonectria olida]|uniref:Flap structure-specific endonuclease n=1 Tax=Thelonectria olida TaxID=1576542 RepID=A0A9P8WIF2_9HYPO|nr:hypothetical protein B0T10DRAFT_602757 [Thelonectria olida]
MGIPGIYPELGPGQRVSLSKLAADSFVNSGRPFRIAIDIAIWQFQAQAARGGANPAIRTLFYRLARLLGTPIEPIFVFDGPKKPAFKRNKRSFGRGDALATASAKRLIQLFGFTTHDAPAEAEAECALLQKHGIVDAVLSEDVDTIMFGCTRTLRNWSAEGKGSSPTHVSLYETKELGLDREGMVLVALMSGGDYLPAGIPGCGVKVACEAAKAGFGKSLCRLKKVGDSLAGIQEWTASLVHELRTNESGYFRTKHKALTIPEDFPRLEVLRYYTHPVVSPQSTLDAVRERFQKRDLHLKPLREFTRETFGWDLVKFVRALGPSLLVDKIQGDGELVKQITGRRTHFSTDATPELRLSFVPGEIIRLPEEEEVGEIPSSRDGLALNSDDDLDDESSKGVTTRVYDPSKLELVWVLEAVARHLIPSSVEEWEAAEAAKAARKIQKAPAKKKAISSKGKAKTGMAASAIDQYVHIIKKNSASTKPSAARRIRVPSSPLESSKQSTTPSPTNSPVRQKKPWTLASSQTTPRTRHEAIIISSSPPCPVDSPPASPSLPPRRLFGSDSCSQELPESVRSILASSNPAEVRDEERHRRGKTRSRVELPVPSSSQSGRLKQTSIDMFATRTPGTSASGASSQLAQSSQLGRPKRAPEQPIQEKPPSKPLSDWSDSGSDLEDLSTLLARPSALSPGKRRKDVLNHVNRSDSTSPNPAPVQKKKLYVPRTSAVGFVKEVEVEVDEYEDRIAEESVSLQRKGARGAVARMSDVVFIDLTGDD